MSFKSLGRRCPVCNGTRKDCRESTTTGLIHCRTDNPSLDYVLKGIDKIGFGMYIHILELDRQKRDREENREMFLLQKQKEREKREQERQEQLAKYRDSLTIEERDREFRKIINGLKLSKSDYKSLRKRGFTKKQIKYGKYRSVNQWQKLPYPVNDALPGVKIGGESLIVHSDGILCPIFNHDGLIIGMQIRYHNAQMSGKYNWLAGEKKRKHRPTSHLRNSELPIGYYESHLVSAIPLIPLPEGITNPVILSEGTSIKPYRISIRTGIITIGASGGGHYNSPEQLKAYLERAGADTIIIAADAGSRNNKNVLSQYRKTKELVESWGYKVWILWWGQKTKDVGDLDECSDERLKAIQYLTWDEFDPETKEDDKEIESSEYDAIVEEQKRNEEIDQLSGEFQAQRDFYHYFSDFLRALGKKAGKYLKKSRTKIKRMCRTLAEDEILDWQPCIPLPKPDEANLPPKIRFKPGHRHLLIIALIQAGWGYILDSSATGTGKSYDTAFIEIPDSMIWYADINHRNPSNDIIKQEFTDLFPRHDGIFEDADGKLRLAKTDEEKEKAIYPSNCKRTSLFTKLAKKGYDPNVKTIGKQNPICATCPAFKTFVKNDEGTSTPKCAAGMAEGSGHKYQRRQTLEDARKIRGHYYSFPQPLDLTAINLEEATNNELWDYSKDIIIWEEFNRAFSGTKVLYGSNADIAQSFDLLWAKKPELYKKFMHIREVFVQLFNNPKDLPRHGYNHEELLPMLATSDITKKDIEEIQSLFTLEDKIVIPDRINYGDVKGIPKESIDLTNRVFAQEAIKETHSNFENMPSNILPILLSVLAGFEGGALRFGKIGKHYGINVTYADNRSIAIAAAAKCNLLLDATGTIENATAKYRIQKNAVIQIEEIAPSLNNLEVIHVKMTGLASNEYSDSGLFRIYKGLEVIKHKHGVDTPVIGLKKYRQKLGFDGHWFNESRGSNDYEGKETMVLVGSPNTNMGAAQDEYYTWYGTLEGFEEHYEQLQQNEIIQAFGRSRAHRYPDRDFLIYFLATNLDLSWVKELGIKLREIEALELTPEAASDSQIARYILFEAAVEFVKSGKAIEKLHQKDLAELTGKSQNAIQKLCAKFGENADGESGWTAMRKELESLVENIRLLFKKDTIEPSVSELLAVAKSNSIFAAWLDMDRAEFIEEFTKFIHGMSFETFKEICFDDPSHTILEKIRFFFAIVGISSWEDFEFFGINFQDWEKSLFSSA